MNFWFPWLHDPDEPLSRRQHTISIWIPRWLQRLVKAKRLVLNIEIGPR